MQVNVVAESKLVRSNRASRLLRIEVQDLDDNQPIFSPTTPVSRRVFTINENDDRIGYLKAIDVDDSPFNSIHYYLLESCAPDYSYGFYLNSTSGELKLLDRLLNISNPLRLCALASPFVHDYDLSSVEFDTHNRSMIEFVVRKEWDRVDARLLQYPNNSITALDFRIQRIAIPLEMYENRELAFELETIKFQPLKGQKSFPGSLDLFTVQPKNAHVYIDPKIILQPEGVFSLRIGAYDLNQTPKQKIGFLHSQVHYVREENRLSFVFDGPIEYTSARAFVSELDTILSDLRGQKMNIVLSTPCAYESNENRNRSRACFYLLADNDQVLSPHEALNSTSTSVNPERRLFELYQQHRLISIEGCVLGRKSRLALGNELMSRELFVWILLVMGAFLILLSLIGYTCFVVRYKEHFWQRTLEQTSKLPPSYPQLKQFTRRAFADKF